MTIKPSATFISACAGSLLLIGFGAFTTFTKIDGAASLNAWSRDAAQWAAGGSAHPLFQLAEPFGSPAVSTVLTVGLAALLARTRGLVEGFAVLAGFGVLAAIEIGLRLRLDALPWSHLPEFIVQPRGWHVIHSTYPSGHTARLAFLVVLAAMTRAAWRAPALLLASVVTFTIATQRVQSHSHSGADVIGATLLAWGVGLLSSAVVVRRQRQRDAPNFGAPADSRII